MKLIKTIRTTRKNSSKETTWVKNPRREKTTWKMKVSNGTKSSKWTPAIRLKVKMIRRKKKSRNQPRGVRENAGTRRRRTREKVKTLSLSAFFGISRRASRWRMGKNLLRARRSSRTWTKLGLRTSRYSPGSCLRTFSGISLQRRTMKTRTFVRIETFSAAKKVLA